MTLHERVGKMTDDQINKFLTLLMGGCWHEKWDWRPNDFGNAPYVCLECNARAHEVPQRPDHLSNPLPVIKWMEKNMPEVWESYLDHIRDVQHEERTEYDTAPTYTDFLILALDLRNLAVYLVAHPSWGERECPSPYCEKGKHNPGFHWEPEDLIHDCPTCKGEGKIIHKALQYLREVKDEV